MRKISFACLFTAVTTAHLGGFAAGVCQAQALLRPPGRTVSHYDFEAVNDQGRKIGDAKGPAPHWYAMGRPPLDADAQFRAKPLHQELGQQRGYPSASAVRMDDRHARSGEYSLFLEVNGGNAGAFVEMGAVPAIPGSDYRVDAHGLSESLHRAGARLTAYFIDAQGRRIEPSVRRTKPRRTAGQWQRFSVTLHGDYPQAAWIGIQVEARQPALDPDNALEDQQVIIKDIDAGVWFDDITVQHVPRATIHSQSRVNIVCAPKKPKLTLDVRDLTGRSLIAQTTVYDENHKIVASDRHRTGNGSSGQWTWTPPLPRLGWYQVEMQLRHPDSKANPNDDAGRLIARTRSPLLWIDSAFLHRGGEGEAFGLLVRRTGAGQAAAGQADPEELALLRPLLERTGIQGLTLNGWDEQTSRSKLAAGSRPIDQTLALLAEDGRSITLSLSPMPQALADRAGLATDDRLGWARVDAALRGKWLRPLVMRHGQRVDRWQLGWPGQAWDPGSASFLKATRTLMQNLRRLTPHPRLALPSRVDRSPLTNLPQGVGLTLAVPQGVEPGQIGSYLQPWNAGGRMPRPYELVLRSPSAQRVCPAHRVRNVVRRMIYAWEAGRAATSHAKQNPSAGGLTRLSLNRPWKVISSGETRVLPDPILGAFANTAKRLAGRRVVDELDLGPGLEARVLDGPAGGMLVVWNEQAPKGTQVQLMLGRPLGQVQQIDVWGNRRPVAYEHGRHRLTVTRTPKFVEGVDANLARFRSGFKLTSPKIESTQELQTRTVTLTNPWPETIRGNLRFTGPEGWDSRPRQRIFAIGPGQTKRMAITLDFPVSEPAGKKQLTARARFHANQAYDVALRTPMSLGLSGVDFQGTLALEPKKGSAKAKGKTDVVVNCTLTNIGRKEKSLSIFANLVGRTRQEHSIAGLEPGQSVVRSFRFPDSAEVLDKYPVRAGVRENDGPAVLNHLLKASDVE